MTKLPAVNQRGHKINNSNLMPAAQKPGVSCTSGRKSMRVRLIVILGVAAVVALVSYELLGPRVVLHHYSHADPIADADKAVKLGDFRLVAVQGRSTHVPGAVSILGQGPALRCATRIIPFTSDTIVNTVIRELNGVSWTYARLYNVRLLSGATGERCTQR